MEEKQTKIVRFGNYGFSVDKNTNIQMVLNNLSNLLKRKINKVKYYLDLLEQEIRDIENMDFSTNSK